jgi:hypothetical protein
VRYDPHACFYLFSRHVGDCAVLRLEESRNERSCKNGKSCRKLGGDGGRIMGAVRCLYKLVINYRFEERVKAQRVYVEAAVMATVRVG